MKLFTPHIVITCTVSLFCAAQANAQCNPNPLSDPLNNTTWAFHAEATDYQPQGSASIGTFFVNRIADPRNAGQFVLALTGTMTVNAGDRIIRLTSTIGKVQYQCDPLTNALRGGTLQFSDGSQAILWQFVFRNGNYNTLFMVNEVYIDNTTLAKVLRGTAVKVVNQQPCPANPLLVLDNTTSAPNGWSLQTESAVFDGVNGTSAIGILNGRFTSDRTGQGSLSGTITTNIGSNNFNFNRPGNYVTRLADTSGRYEVYSGCTGGAMSFVLGSAAAQYEFVFASGDFSELFLLGTTTRGANIIFDSRSISGPEPKLNIASQLAADILKGTMSKF